MDWSIYPQKIINGETYYFFDGSWVKPIDMNDLTPTEEYLFEKIPNKVDDTKHTFLASQEAMIEGCYKFLKIEEVEKQVPSDNPGRFMAKALYKRTLNESYFDSKGRSAEVNVRLNPLLNKDAGGRYMDNLRSQNNRREKSLLNFKDLFLDKEIEIERIKLVENKTFNTKSYVYTWNYI